MRSKPARRCTLFENSPFVRHPRRRSSQPGRSAPGVTQTPDRRLEIRCSIQPRRAQNLPVIIGEARAKIQSYPFRIQGTTEGLIFPSGIDQSLIRCFNSQTRKAAKRRLFVRVRVPTAGRARPETGLSLDGWGARFGLRVFLHFGTGRAADSLTLR